MVLDFFSLDIASGTVKYCAESVIVCHFTENWTVESSYLSMLIRVEYNEDSTYYFTLYNIQNNTLTTYHSKNDRVFLLKPTIQNSIKCDYWLHLSMPNNSYYYCKLITLLKATLHNFKEYEETIKNSFRTYAHTYIHICSKYITDVKVTGLFSTRKPEITYGLNSTHHLVPEAHYVVAMYKSEVQAYLKELDDLDNKIIKTLKETPIASIKQWIDSFKQSIDISNKCGVYDIDRLDSLCGSAEYVINTFGVPNNNIEQYVPDINVPAEYLLLNPENMEEYKS